MSKGVLYDTARERLLSQGWTFTGGYLVLTTDVEGDELYSPSGERSLLSDQGAVYSVRPEWVRTYTPPGIYTMTQNPPTGPVVTGTAPPMSNSAESPASSGSGWLLGLIGAVAAWRIFKR